MLQPQQEDENALEVKHVRNIVLYGLMFFFIFLALAFGMTAVMKMSAVNELTSSQLFNVMGYKNVSTVLTSSGLSDFGTANILEWVLPAIGFTLGAVIGWNKK